jgi:putative hemolysin
MSVTQTDTVDHIGISPEQEVVLTISDHLSWQEADHLALLETKLNSYLRFIDSDQLLEVHPAAEHHPVVIQVVLQYEPPEQAVVVLSQVKEAIESQGIGFRWWVFSE